MTQFRGSNLLFDPTGSPIDKQETGAFSENYESNCLLWSFLIFQDIKMHQVMLISFILA